MNKKTVSKVNLFFGGLVSRMEENKDFFNDITINLKSGTKNFPAKILYTDDITLDYQAVKRKVEKDDLWDIIAEELLKYDEAQIIYSERGAKIVIDANDKKVNMRHEDVTKEINKTSVVQTGREYVVNPALAKDLLEEIGSYGTNLENDLPDMIRSLKGRIHFAHVRNLKFNSPTDFEEAAHLSSDGSFDMYEIIKALYEIGFEGPIRPDHGRMIWDEVAMPGYGLYDRALGATYLNGLWEAIEKSSK